MKYPATWEEYKAQKQNRKAAGDSTAASGSSPLPATWEEYKAQKQAKAQQLPATQTDTAEREKCLNASGFKAMQTDIQGLFGTMDGYFSTYHKIGASSKWQKDQVSKMLQNVAQEKDYFNRYADVMGEDAQSYQKQLNAWEAQLKRYQKAMNGQEDDEGSLALGSGIARFQTEADAYFKKAQETTAGMSEPERANQWVSGAQTLLTEAQEIEAYLKKKNTPAAQTLMTQMAEYRKALEDMQTSARGAQLTNPLTGKAMPDVAISGRMRLPRYTADGKVQTGYGSAYDRRLGQQEERTLAAGMERKAEKADWQNQTVQQHEDYIRQDFEELKEYTSANTSSSQVENIHAGIFTEIAERLNYLALSGKCTGSEYEALLDKVEQWKNEYLAHAENVRKEKNNRAGNITHGELYWKDGKIVKYREAGYDKDTAAIDKIRSEAKSLLPSKGDAMKEFRYQSGNLTRENIAYTPVDELLGKMGFDHGGTDWGTSDAERRAVTFLSEEVLPEYLANTEMTQEQYDAFMQQIADAPNAAELRATREANGLNANEAGMQSALEMYRKIDAKTYADMAGTGAVNAMENVMTKYAGGMEQVLMRGLGYLTKAAGKTLNLFGLAENPVGNYFVEGGQQGIDYENKDWQEGKQREYEAGRYASELTQNGNKFTKFTANMTRDLTQAALEMAAAGAIAGQISAGNTALSQLSQGGKYASSLANAQKRVSGYTKFAGQMANLMKNSSNVLISANAALNSYGEAEDAGKSMPERAVKLIAGGLIEYGTNGLFGGNPIVDPENAGLISKYITDLTDNETIRKIVSSKVFDRIGEGLEEVASAVAGAALDYALTGETDLTAKELVDEFTVGVLLSMVMSAPEDIVDLTARAKSYVQSKVITRFGKQAQSNLDVLYGTMAQYTAQYYAGDENLMRFNGWSESQIKKAKGEWNTIVREFNTLADRLESAQNISESFERYTPPQANGGFVDVEMQNIIRAEQQSNAALMTDRALDIQIITQRATIEALRGSTDAGDIFVAEAAQSYLDVLGAEKSARAAEKAQRAAESAAQENIPTAEQTAQEAPQTAQETAQSAEETVEQAEEINAPAAQETEGGMSNEQSQSVNENQERNERVGAEGQTGGVVESGSRIAADRGGTGEAGGNENENLRRQKLNERVERFKGTVLDTGMDKLTADGDPDVMVGIVPVRKYTQAMKQAQREAKEQGVKTTFVVGTMSIKGEDGEYHNTDAMFDAESGRIFVSVSSIYEPEVLMEHELFHAKVHAAEIDLVTALKSVSENMTAEEYTEIVEQYMKAYRGAYDSDAAVYEEILADAYAGLNRFVNRSFKKLIDAMRTHAAAMRSQRESSAPTEEVSSAVRRTQDSDGNEKTAREGGTRASMAGPKAKTASSKNLALAEAMEEDGASREEIWRKTGWIRGADGQWRFEVDDSKAEFRPNGDARLMGEPRYRRLEELTDKWGDSFEKGEEPLTEAEEAEMEALQEEYSDRVWEKKYELQDFLKHDELYEAYPLLRHTTVRFEKLDPGVKGKFDKRNGAIILSDSLFGKGPETLLHEIQHIIQKYEGFQGGTSPEYWARRDYESGDRLQERLQREYSDILNGLTKEEQNDYIRYQEIDGELERLFYSEKPGDTEKYDRMDAEHDRLYEKLYPKEWFGKLLDLKRQMENPGEVYLGQYINSAGEIEARETASRRKMTAEERQNKMPDLGWDRALLTEGGEGTSKVQLSLDNPEGFAEAITQWDADGRRKTDFILGSTGEVLQGLGAIESDVYMRSEKIETILKQHPEMSLEEIKKIPSVLNDPVLVLKSRQSDSKRGNSRVVVFGSMKNTNGAPMLAVLDLRPVEGNLLIEDMQKVVSAYVKTGNPAGFLKNSEAMFVDKKRAARLLRSTGLQLRPGSLPPSGYIGSITYRGKNVNITGKQFSEFLQETKETDNENLTTIRNLNEDDLEALYGSARIPVQELLANTEGAGDVSLIVKNEDTRNNNAHLENMAAVIPSSMDWWLVERLKMNGLNVVEYRAGNEQARQEAEAEAEKLLEPKKRFSLSPEEKVQRAENKLTAAQEKLEQEKEKAQERYKRDLTSGMRRLFNIQSYDSKELNGLLETPMLEMQQGVKLLKAEKDDLFEAVMNLGTETMPADDYYREIRDTIYGQKVFVPEWVRTEFGDDWNSFKKRAMGRHKFYFVEDEGKQGIDQLYKELAEQYPGAFPDTYDMTEMLRRMEDMADKGMDTKLPYRQAMEENEKRFGMTVDEQTEYQRTAFERLLNSYAEKAGRDARIAQDKAAKAEADERLESILREADGVQPTKKAEGVVEPWTISEAAAQKRGFPFLNGKQVYPLRTWVKAADMGNYGLVLDKSTKKGMLTVLFTNKETGLSSVKDMETKLLTAVEPKYQPSVQETAALLASMPPEKLEDAADAEDLGAFYEWYDGQTEGRETNDLRLVAEERAEKSRQAAQEIEKQRGESALEKQEAYEQKKAERIEGIRKAYLESFGTTEPKLPYGKDRPMQSRFTTLQPGEALSLLQAMTGTKWALTNNADGTWKATMTKDPAPKTSISPKEALERLEAAKKTYGQQIPGVHPEGIAKENFKGSPALEKAGVKIDGGIADYGQVETMRKGAETRRSVKWQIDKTIQRMEATKQEIRAAKKIAQGKQEYYRLPDKCRPEVVSQLSALYLNERMTGEDLIQVRKSEIRDGLFYKMMELFPTENEIMANPELFKAEKLLVLNYRTALRSMVNIFGEERGMEIYNYLFAPVIRNTAESYRWTNQQFDDVKEFTDSSGKKSRLNETERAYVHMMLDVEGYVEKAEHSERGDILKDAAKKVAKGESISNETIEFALNSEEAKIVEKYAQWINGKDTEGIDKKKCENAMQEYRKKFDLYFEAINDFLVAHGMQPIGRIQGYTPHMPLAEKFNLMSKALEVLGLNETVTTLPAEISGRTEGFRPQRRWNPFLLERKTDKTAYDIEEAFQSYVQYLSDILFHTDDIQKVRAAESYLRKGLRGNFVDDLQKAIDMSRSSDAEEKIEYLQEMGQIGADDYDLSDAEMMQVFDRLISELVGEETNKTRYSPLVVWLKNYGDILAGKQFGGDRGTEYGGGREWLNIGNKLVGAFAKANVAGNLSSVLNQSAQLAMLQATRSQRAILKATQEFCTGKLGEFRKEIDFLTGKKGIDYLVQSGTDKFISGMFAPAEFMDSMLSTIATRAAYWDAIRNGKNHEEAMRFADWYGRALMGDRTKGAKPLKFHSKGVVVQMLNVFQIEPLNTVEFVMQDMPLEIKREAREHGKKSAARMLLRTIFGYLIAAFVLNRLTDELYGGTPAPLDIAGLTANFFASGKGLPTNDYIKNLINKVVGSEIFDVQEPKEGFDTSAAIKDTGYNLMNEIPFASNLSGLLGVGDRSMPFPNIFGTGKNFYDALFPGNGKSANGQEVLEKGLEFLAELVPGGRQAKKTGYGIKAIAQGGKTKGYGDNERLLYALDTDNVWNDIRTVLFGTNATPEANRYYAGDSYGLNADQTKLWKELREEGVNGYALYGLMMRMDDAMNYSDIPEPKDDESEEEKAKRLQQKEEHRKKARAELVAQEGLTDGQRMRIYSAMLESGKNDAIDKLLDIGMKWKDISEILDKRGELKAGKTESEWAAEFASWLDGKKYSGKNREAINEALVPKSASFYNKMTAAGVEKNSAIKIEEIARKAAKADGKNFSEAYQARAVAQAGLSENEAYKALCAIYSEGTAEKFKEAHEAGIPAKEYTKFWLAQAELESDRDEDGEFISGSKREKVIELIDSLSLTAEQKDWIMSQKYKSYDWWMMPWS
jgi:hypothetical protein